MVVLKIVLKIVIVIIVVMTVRILSITVVVDHLMCVFIA